MTLWFGLALMTAAAIFAVLWPLARRTANLRSGSDVAVYRDQLEEIERDRAAGLIADNEAAAAQVEVSRRLLAAADAPAAPQASADVGGMAPPGGRARGASCACRSAPPDFTSRSARRRCRISRSRRVLPRRAAISRSTA